MRDIRLLTLYKQHYLDDYKDTLQCQYSCLGYYDGLNINKVDTISADKEKALSVKKSQSPISELWYSMGNNVTNLKGGFSSNTIGLFRDIPEHSNVKDIADSFWNDRPMPYYAVAFLKVSDIQNIDHFINRCENDKFKEDIVFLDGYCKLITYYTFDLADLVVLLQSNSLNCLLMILHKIEFSSDINYMHSVIGIRQEYLDCCTGNEIPAIWNGYNCNINESISDLRLKIATSGKREIIEYLKFLLDQENAKYAIKNYDSASYSYVTGHENLVISIKETDVKCLLILLRTGGFSTHQNEAYRYDLYNIETSLYMEKSWSGIEGKDWGNPDNASRYWCRDIIKRFIKKLDPAKKQGDESLYACYQAVIKTFNMLDQYENFNNSRHIFDFLYLPSKQFIRQLENTVESLESETYYIKIEDVKKSIREYLDCVNSIVYHVIHTNQVYFMAPGYSDSSVSVPIKLNMLYIAFIYKVIELLNDEGKEYSCITTPVIETRPVTNLITFGASDRNRLIRIRLAQRSLFFPRTLMIILCHEMAHYVGNTTRNRKYRLECLMRSITYYISEGIFPSQYNMTRLNNLESKVFKKLKEYLPQRIQITVLEAMNEYFKTEFVESDYYGEEIRDGLKKICNMIISTEGGILQKVIYEIPSSVFSMDDSDNEFVNIMKYVSEIQQNLNKNRVLLQVSGVIDEVIDNLINLYREVFSDVVATTILNCEKSDFIEAFYISEGLRNEHIKYAGEQNIRLQLADQYAFNPSSGHTSSLEDDSEELVVNIKFREEYNAAGLEKYLLTNMVSFEWVLKHLNDYATRCKQEMSRRIEDPEIKKMCTDIREFYSIFADSHKNCDEIYREILFLINEYVKKVDAIYSKS